MSDVRRRVGSLERELGPVPGVRPCSCGAGGKPLTGILLMGDEPAPEPRHCPECGGEMLTIRIVEDVVTVDGDASKGETE